MRKAIAQQSAGDPIAFNQDNDLFQLWEKDVTALIEEYQRLQSDIVEVELSPELTATDIVALKQNPEQFARRSVVRCRLNPIGMRSVAPSFTVGWNNDLGHQRFLMSRNYLAWMKKSHQASFKS